MSTALANAETVVIAIEGAGLRQSVLGSCAGRRGGEGQGNGVDVVVVAPPQESDIQGQIALVEDQLAKNIDGLAIAPTDPNALGPVIEERASRRRRRVHRHQGRQ